MQSQLLPCVLEHYAFKEVVFFEKCKVICIELFRDAHETKSPLQQPKKHLVKFESKLGGVFFSHFSSVQNIKISVGIGSFYSSPYI